MRRLHIVVDLTLLLPGGMNGGIKPGFFGLFQELRNLAADELSCTFLSNSWSHGDLDSIRRRADTAVCIKALEGRQPNVSDFKPNDYALIDPPSGWIESLGADIYYNPLCENLPETGSLPVILLHPDVLHRDVPDALTPDEVLRREQYFQANAKRAKRIQTISEFSQKRLEKLFPDSKGKVFVTRLPVQKRFEIESIDSNYQIQGDYFLYPANFWPHKNHEFLLQVFSEYKRKFAAGKVKLVLTGDRNERADYLQSLAQNMGISEQIIFTGHLSDREFASVFHGALALLFPSNYEGFGIPPLESMHLGVPVICSDAGGLKEVVKNGGHVLPASDLEKWTAALNKVRCNKDWRDELIARGHETVRHFSLVHESQVLLEEFNKLIKIRLTNDLSN